MPDQFAGLYLLAQPIMCRNKFNFAGISGDAKLVHVAPGVSVEFSCTGPDHPTWFLNGISVISEGNCYRSAYNRKSGELNATAVLTIKGNHTCNTFNVYCRILSEPQFFYLYNTTLTIQG